jgi:hypothetical protein
MTLISNDTIGFISTSGEKYTYNLTNGTTSDVGKVPFNDIGDEGSCRTLIKDGIPIGIKNKTENPSSPYPRALY